MKTILIIEDDENLSRGITFVFEKDGYVVISTNTLKDGWQSFKQNHIDIIILDLGLPDGNGMELCRSIRLDGRSGRLYHKTVFSFSITRPRRNGISSSGRKG